MYLIENYFSSISINDYVLNYRDVSRFIFYCRECRQYGNCWSCPPFDFDIEETVLKYKWVYIIGTKIVPSEEMKKSCSKSEDSKEMGAKMIESVRKVIDPILLKIESVEPKCRTFFAGTCHICSLEDCTRIKGIPCKYPERIRPSLESFGFDIGKTTEKLLGIELKWSEDGMLPEYLTLVSGIFSNTELLDIEKYFMEQKAFSGIL